MDGRRHLGAATAGSEIFSRPLHGPRLGGRQGMCTRAASESGREFGQRQVGDDDVGGASERLIQRIALGLGDDELREGAGIDRTGTSIATGRPRSEMITWRPLRTSSSRLVRFCRASLIPAVRMALSVPHAAHRGNRHADHGDSCRGNRTPAAA
jgi:hypothetical protein